MIFSSSAGKLIEDPAMAAEKVLLPELMKLSIAFYEKMS